MSFASTMAQARGRLTTYWLARTEQERKLLAAGGGVLLLALLYAVLIDPAVSGRARLKAALPELRQQAAQMQTLAAEAAALAATPVVQVTPMTREALAASLNERGLAPQSLTMTGEYAKLQLTGVSFANLIAWLDAQRRENRIGLQDGVVTAQATPGQVDATLTLRQNTGSAAGAR